jgi:hypothetical protein
MNINYIIEINSNPMFYLIKTFITVLFINYSINYSTFFQFISKTEIIFSIFI